MIEIKKYKEILDAGLLLDHYALLCNIRDGKELLRSRRIQGFLNLLCKKGYVEDGTLTATALLLIDSENVKLSSKSVVRFIDDQPIQNEGKFDYAGWVIRLHKKCEAKIIAATGKKQVRRVLDGTSYSFLLNPTDLGKVILRAVNRYRLKDFDKIEKCILLYVDSCIKKDKWFPLLGYYIMKNEMSTMVTDMDSMGEEEIEDNDSIVNI